MFETLGPSIDDLSTDEFIEGLADMFCPPPPASSARNERYSLIYGAYGSEMTVPLLRVFAL